MIISVTAPGRLSFGGRIFRCALGRGGIVIDKREGDGGTPAGRFPLRRVMYRPDRLAAPETGLAAEPISADQGWCDDPADPDYNRLVRLPFAASHEKLWRDDRIYDVVAVLGHNDDPPVAGKGSAIFMHVARPDYAATDGCIALSLPDLLAVLAAYQTGVVVDVSPPDRAGVPRK